MNLILYSAWLHWITLVILFMTTLSLWYAGRNVKEDKNIWVTFWAFFALCIDRLASVYIALVVGVYGEPRLLVDPWRVIRLFITLFVVWTLWRYLCRLIGSAIGQRCKNWFKRWIMTDEQKTG